MNTNCFSPKTFCRVMNKAGERGIVPREGRPSLTLRVSAKGSLVLH
jgi:hypothetical protein